VPNPALAFTGNAIGLLYSPLFLATAIMGIITFRNSVEAKEDHTRVRVYLGYGPRSDGRDTGGDIPEVCVYDRLGVRIGCAKHKGKLKPGTFVDINCDNDKKVGNRRAAYIKIFASGNDGVCISGITVSSMDGYKSNWLGDMAAVCENQGVLHYLSRQPIGDSQHEPYCVWLDRDHSPVWTNSTGKDDRFVSKIPHKGFTIHLEDVVGSKDRADYFNGNQTFPDEKDLPKGIDHHRELCGVGARFKAWPEISKNTQIPFFDPPIVYYDNGTEENPEAIFTAPTGITVEPYLLPRDVEELPDQVSHEPSTPGSRGFDAETIVIDKRLPAARRAATALCSSRFSLGPSFASVNEGMFCEMQHKTLHKICGDDPNQSDCFDLNTKKLHGAHAEDTDTFGVASTTTTGRKGAVVNSWSDIDEWDVDGVVW
jgi:hypothetical protein